MHSKTFYWKLASLELNSKQQLQANSANCTSSSLQPLAWPTSSSCCSYNVQLQCIVNTMCNVQCAICNVQCAVCIQYTMCNVQCAVTMHCAYNIHCAVAMHCANNMHCAAEEELSPDGSTAPHIRLAKLPQPTRFKLTSFSLKRNVSGRFDTSLFQIDLQPYSGQTPQINDKKVENKKGNCSFQHFVYHIKLI